ncbi:MAG: cellulase family glycosylhydrolase, partial [Candidatus Marinimicrobia bacterium]|nr:cellulase family glycosylhydrolase [Candidatus Neomarinimicrobiota bacterium]
SSFVFCSGFLKTQGRIIVDENDEKIIFKGFGLGGWVVLEGYMWNYPGFGSTTTMENAVEDLIGQDKKDEFFSLYRANYITEKDINFLSQNGFNALRIPLHYKHFSPSFNEFINDGFELLDPIINACRNNNMYVILDMHAAPGAQNTSDFSDSDGQTAKLFTEYSNQKWLTSVWRYIAEYYSNEPVVAAYDLLNEPVLPWGYGPQALRNIYEWVIDSIRTVDPNHVVIIEGNWYGNDHTGLLPPFDDEMVYSFHHYVGGSTDTTTMYNQYRTGISLEYNVPLWVGEFGENSNYWGSNIKSFFERNDIGWSWWNYKSVERISSLFSYEITEEYQTVLNYWQGSSAKPDTNTAFNCLMSMANSLHFDSCKVNEDLIRALVDPTYNSIPISYSNFSPPGLLPATDYDSGNNSVSYFDNWVEDPNKFSPETKSWNNGWSYRNDGVDIGSTIINNQKNYYVGWIEAGEWMRYTIKPEEPGNYKMMVEIASYINGSSLSVEFDSGMNAGPINLPNTNGWSNGWRVVNIGNVAISDETSFKILADVGGFNIKNIIFEDLEVSSIPMDLKLNCYPNPTNSFVTIKWNSDFILLTDITIYDILGNILFLKQMVSGEGENSLNWHLKYMNHKMVPSGIYFVEVKTSNKTSVKKITYLK